MSKTQHSSSCELLYKWSQSSINGTRGIPQGHIRERREAPETKARREAHDSVAICSELEIHPIQSRRRCVFCMIQVCSTAEISTCFLPLQFWRRIFSPSKFNCAPLGFYSAALRTHGEEDARRRGGACRRRRAVRLRSLRHRGGQRRRTRFSHRRLFRS